MKRSMILACGAAAFAVFAGVASAQMNVMAADLNKDGKITLDESFASKDANKDGFVTEAELGQAAMLYMPADANKDGKLSKAEYSGPNSFFTKSDANKDGALTEAEIMGAISTMRPPG